MVLWKDTVGRDRVRRVEEINVNFLRFSLSVQAIDSYTGVY
jgi:hypothetical protein